MSYALDPAAIRRLAKTPAVTAEFPFLIPFGKRSVRSCCGAAPGFPDAGPAISKLAKMSAARKNRFKELIGAETVTAFVKRAARIVPVDF